MLNVENVGSIHSILMNVENVGSTMLKMWGAQCGKCGEHNVEMWGAVFES